MEQPATAPSGQTTAPSSPRACTPPRVNRRHNGFGAAALSYDFSAVDSGYITFRTRDLSELLDTQPEAVSLWLLGDGSLNTARFRIIDATGESFASATQPLDYNEWRELSYAVDKSWGHWSGDDDGEIDLPISTLVLEVSYAEGGAATGTLYIDDWAVTVGGSSHIVEDFERLSARERLLILADDEPTEVVLAEGIGPDLSVPIPALLARRSGSTRFDVLHEPFGAEGAAVTEFETLSPISAPAEAAAARIASPGLEERLILSPGGSLSSFGAISSDGRFAYLAGTPSSWTSMVLYGGSVLNDEARLLLETSCQALELSLGDATLFVEHYEGDLNGTRVYAPGLVNLSGAPGYELFEDGEMVLIAGEAIPPLDATEGEGDIVESDSSSGDIGSDSDFGFTDTTGSADTNSTADTDAGEALEFEDEICGGVVGCGCQLQRGASHPWYGWFGLALLALIGLRRK